MFFHKRPGGFTSRGPRFGNKETGGKSPERRHLRSIASRQCTVESLEARLVLSHSPWDTNTSQVLAAAAPPLPAASPTPLELNATARYGDVTRIDLKALIEAATSQDLDIDPMLGSYEFNIAAPFVTGTVANDGVGTGDDHYLSDVGELFIDRGVLYYIPQITTPSTGTGVLGNGAASDISAYELHFIDATDNSDEIVYTGDINVSIDQTAANGYSTYGENSVTFGTGRLDTYRVEQRLRYLGFYDAIGNTANLLTVDGTMDTQTKHAIGVFNETINDTQTVNENSITASNSINNENAPRWVQVSFTAGITNVGANEEWMTSGAKTVLNAADAATPLTLPFIGATTKGGGDTASHASHEAGMDIDIDTAGTNDGATPFYKTNTIAGQKYIAAKAPGDAAANNYIARNVSGTYVAKRFQGTVTGATNTSPIVITSAGHGLANGEQVTISGVLGNTNANGTYTVGAVTTNTFTLVGRNGNAAYTSGGTWVLAVAPSGAVAHVNNVTLDSKATLTGVKDLIVDGPGYNLANEQAKINAFRNQGTTAVASIYFNDPRTWTTSGVPVTFSSGHGGHFHVNVQKPALVSADEQRGLLNGFGEFFQNLLPGLTENPDGDAGPSPAGGPAGSPTPAGAPLNPLGLSDIPFVDENFGDLIDLVDLFDDLSTHLVQKASAEGQAAPSSVAVPAFSFFVIFDGQAPFEVTVDAGTYPNKAAWLAELNTDALASVPYSLTQNLDDVLIAKDVDSDGLLEFETVEEGFTQSLTITTLRLTAGSAAVSNGQLAADATFDLDLIRPTGTSSFSIDLQVHTPTDEEEDAASPYTVPHTNDNFNLDTLIEDLNDALIIAGVADVVATKDPGGTKIVFAATDPTITSLTVNNIADDAGLGFANGAIVTEAYNPGLLIPPSSPLGFAGSRDVPDLKYPTIEDLIDNLATELAAISDGPLPGGFTVDSVYDADTDTIYFNLALNKNFTKTIPLDFDKGFDLGPLGTLQIVADANATFNATVDLQFRAGMYLGALGSDFTLDPSTLLADLNGGDGVAIDVGIRATNAAPSAALASDVSFNLRINGVPTPVTIDDATTVGNANLTALAADLNNKLSTVPATGYVDPAVNYLSDLVKFAVDTAANRLTLRGIHHEVYSVGATNISNLSALGFTGAELPNRPDIKIIIDPAGVATQYLVDLDGAVTVGDVITKIQAAAPVTVTINADKGLSVKTISGAAIAIEPPTETVDTGEIDPITLLPITIEVPTSSAASTLGILGSSSGDTIAGTQLHGESSIDRIFVVESDPGESNLSISASFETSGLNLSAGLGFLSFDVTASDDLLIEAQLDARLTDPSPSPDGNITLQEILDTEAIEDLVDLDTPTFNIDGTLEVSSPMLLALSDSSSIATLDVSLADPTDITSIQFDFSAANMENAFKGLKDLSLQQILDIVHNVVGMLSENDDIPWLNTPLPIVDASLSDALGFLDDLLDKVDEITAGLDQAAIDELNEKLDTVESAIADMNIPFLDKDLMFRALDRLRSVLSELDVGSFSGSGSPSASGGSPAASPEVGDITTLPARLLAATKNIRNAIEAVPGMPAGKQELLDALDTFESLVPDLEKLEERLEDEVETALESLFGPNLDVTVGLDLIDYNCNTAAVENALIVNLTLDGSNLLGGPNALSFEPDLNVPDLGPIGLDLDFDAKLHAGGKLTLGFGAQFDLTTFKPFVVIGAPTACSASITDLVRTRLDLNAGFAVNGSADVRFGTLDLVEGDVDLTLVKGVEDHLPVSAGGVVNLSQTPLEQERRFIIVHVDGETDPRPLEDFNVVGSTLTFASNVKPTAGTLVRVSYRRDPEGHPSNDPTVVANRAQLAVTFNHAPTDTNTIGALPLTDFVSDFVSSMNLDVQGILTGSVDATILNSTAENVVTLAIAADDPLDPQFEVDADALEDAFNNIDFDLTLLCNGVEALLNTVETGLTSEIASKLPLVGGALNTTGTFIGKMRTEFVTPICDFLGDVGGSLEDVAGFIKQEVFDLLGPSGIDILADREEDADSTIDTDDVIVNLTTDDFEIIVTLAGSDETTVDFNTNVAGLPIDVQASGGVRVGWDYEIDFGVGISRESGFYFVLNSDEDDMDNNDPEETDDPEFQFNLDVGLAVDNSGATPVPTSFGIDLFGLELTATDILKPDGTRGTGLSGLLTLDIADDGGADPDGRRRLVVSDIGDRPFADIFTAKLDTLAEISLELAAEIDANLPSIRTDLMASFGVSVSTGPDGIDVDFDTPTLQFKDIRLDLGDFLSKHIGKVLKDVDKFIEPIKPVVKFLRQEVPGLSQLSELAGRGKVTFLDLAFLKNPEQGKTAKIFLGVVDQIIDLIDTLSSFGPGENVSINFGTITIDAANGFSFDNNLWAENLDTGALLGDASNSSFGNSVTSQIDTLNAAVASVFQKAEQEPDPDGENGLGLSIDIIKPENIIKLLLGQRANIVTWNIPRFEVNFSLEMSFHPIPIVYPFVVTIGFDFGAFADFSVGYDTRGIETGNFFDGFFFGDRANVDSGEDIAEMGLILGARLRAELDLLVASAGIEGALVATIDANWRDVDDDGKMYLDEIAQIVKQDGLLCLFDISGELRAIIRLVWSIFGADDSKDIINALIFSFHNECPKYETAHVTEASESLPDGTTVPAGTLVLHSGMLADQRQPGTSTDVSEDFKLTQVAPGVISVEGMGFTQRFGGVLQIFADGGAGNDKLVLVDVTMDATLRGGAGNDTLTSLSGNDLVDGGSGNDLISTGLGADTASGGSGNDTIDTSDGADSITGGDDNDSITSGQGKDTIDAGKGNDYVDAGTEDDSVIGGAGDDTIFGRAGADSITGDAGKDSIEGGQGNDTIDAGSQNDTVYGQEGADSIDGGAGRDYLEGNAANDTIYGGSGYDTILGQSGNDSLRGGSGHDSMVGDIGDDTMSGDADNDLLIGNDGVDDLFGGFGNDVIYSYIPGDTDDPANTGHHVEGNPDDDFICGTQSLDTIWGGTHDEGYNAYWTEWTTPAYPGAPLAGGFTPIGCESTGTVTFDDPGYAVIKGRKFSDANSNGVEDAGEVGLAGWTIQLIDDDGEVVDEVVTGADGTYEFTDIDGATYTLVELMQTGWVQTYPASGSHTVTVDGGQTADNVDFGNYKLASVSGVKWLDSDQDGVHDENEPGLAGVLVWADADNDGVWDPVTEVATTTAVDDPLTTDVDETGTYTLENLYPGSYTIREVVPAGYVRTYPVRNVVSLDRFESVTVSRDWASNSPLHPGALDIDRTPASNRGFLGPFGNETVTLSVDDIPAHSLLNISFDVFVLGSWNGNVVAPNGPDRFQMRVDGSTQVNTTFSNTTNNQAYPGVFGVGNNPARTGAAENNTLGYGLLGAPAVQPPANPADSVYHFSIAVPHVGSTLTLDFQAIVAALAGEFEQWGLDNVVVSFPIDGHSVTLGSGDSVDDLDFGNYARPGEIHGTKFIDADNDGVRDANESGLGGVTIYLDTNNNGHYDAGEPSTVTATALSGDFNNDAAVDLNDLAILQSHSGQCSVTAAQGDLTGDGCVTRQDVAIFAVNFGRTLPMPGIKTGEYWFTDLEPGNYVVREIVPAGYVQTAPTAGSYSLTVNAGNVITGRDFGNLRGGEIHGTKYFDVNGDGRRGVIPGSGQFTEPGMAGVTVYIDKNNNGQLDPGEPTTVTMADDPLTPANEAGMYWFTNVAPGVNIVREVVPEGCRQTAPQNGFTAVTVASRQSVTGIDFGNLCEGEIHGVKWFDTNGNRQRDANAQNVLEPLMGGVTIYLDVNNNGHLDAGEPTTVTMADIPTTQQNETGMYWFQHVPMGTYVVREVVPAGMTQTYPIAGGHVVVVAAGGVVDNINFGNTASGGEIHGTKWNDLNRNRERDSGAAGMEPGVAGVTIYLDTNHNGQFNAGEPSTVTMADDPTTAESELGMYWFTDVPAGTYDIREVLPTGWTQSWPTNNGAIVATVANGQAIFNANFGNYRDSGSVSGTKYQDTDGDGKRTPATEPGIAGVRIYSDLNNNLAWDANEPSTLTLADNPVTPANELGTYLLTDLAPGVHRIREVVPAGFVQSTPISNGGYTVTVVNGQTVTARDFGNYRPGQISGVKWNDNNGNGLRDANGANLEAGIPGVTIYIDVNNDGQFQTTEPSTVTLADVAATPQNEAGTYSFTNLAPGLYRVREVVPVGMVQTFPTAANPNNVQIQSGTIATNVNFGNRVTQTAINISSFESQNQVAVNGNAAIGGGRLTLTNNAAGQRGSAFLPSQVQFTSDFTFQTHFVFEISNPGGTSDVDGPGGQGLTFVIHSSASGAAALGTGGGGMGLAGIAPAVAVEFDTFDTGAFDLAANAGTNGSHIGVDVSSIATSIAQTSALPRFNAGGQRHAWIDYDGFGDVMQIYFSATNVKPATPTLVTSLNLTGPTQLWVGFTAATDAAFNRHQIVSWQMNVGAPPPSPGANGAATGAPTFSFFDGSVQAPPAAAAAPTPAGAPATLARDDCYFYSGQGPLTINAPGVLTNDSYTPATDTALLTTQPSNGSVTLSADGKFTYTGNPPFGGLDSFTYVIVDANGTASNTATVRLTSGKCNGSAFGYKYNDANGNGVPNAGESGLGGVTIFADVDDDGELDPGEPSTTTLFDDPSTAAINEAGQWRLDNLPLSTVTIREVVPMGYYRTQPATGGYTVDASGGQSFDGLFFGNARGATVHGTKWLDANGNHEREGTEPGLAGVRIYDDRNNNGQYDQGEPTTITMADDPLTPSDETGSYWLGIPPSTNLICEVVPQGMVQTFPVQPPCYTVVAQVGQDILNINFGNKPQTGRRGEIHGMKWDDYKGPLGGHDADEPGVPGITIYLDLNQNGQLDPNEPSTVTMADDPNTPANEAGMYWFLDVPAGVYQVREILPDGFAQTFPAPPNDFNLVAVAGNVVQNVNFGNFEYIIIPDGADEIYGAAGNDRLLGDNEVSDPRTLSFGDNDTVFGEAGQDTLNGQDEDDELWGGADHDDITGGIDPTESDRVLQEVDANQVLSNALLTGQGNDTLTSIEHGTLIGGPSANTLDARPFTLGSVSLVGMAGNDSLFGTTFGDELFGGDDNTTMPADGNDRLEAGDGDDSLTGGEGSDNLIGGLGDDTFFFPAALAVQTDTVDEAAVANADTLDFQTLNAATPVTVNLTTGVGTHANRTLAFVNPGFIEIVLGGAGNDVLTGAAGANNRLVGNGGADTLAGVGGTNTLVGGTGNDTITGGTSNDTFVFEPNFGVDTASDLGGASDTFDLTAVSANTTVNVLAATVSVTEGANSINLTSNNVERFLSGAGDDIYKFTGGSLLAGGAGTIAASTGIDLLDYSLYGAAVTVNLTTSTATGTAGISGFENVTGSSAGDNITGDGNANELLGLGGSDTLVGLGGPDHLVGGGGNDANLDGGAGNDTIEGGLGNDAMTGGLGDDLFIFATPSAGAEADSITESSAAAGGVDSLDFTFLATALNVNLPAGTITHSLRAVTIVNPTSVENISSGSGGDTFTGDAGNNRFTSGLGDDTLTGGGGDDMLIGGGDDDTYRFALAAASDTVVIEEQPSGGSDLLDFSLMSAGDFVRASIAAGGLDATPGLIAKHGTDPSRTVTIANPALAINFEHITGSAGNDVLTGSVIANAIIGGNGNDEIHGGDGNDFLDGGIGNDTIFGEKHDDLLIGGPGVNVLDGGTHHDTYQFTQGSAANDTLREDPSQVIDGLTVIGGQDTLYFEPFTTAITVDLSSTAAQNPATGLTMTLKRVNNSANSDYFENVVGSTTNANNLTGNLADNSLTGGNAADTLTGNAGDDTLTGGPGNDRLIGGADDDVLIYDSADTVSINGGAGSDTLRFVAAGSLNLATASQVTGIDVIDLGGFGASVSATPAAILAATDASSLLVLGTNADTVTLTGGFSLTVNGSTADIYTGLTRVVTIKDGINRAASSPEAPAAIVAQARDRVLIDLHQDAPATGGLSAMRVARAAARLRADGPAAPAGQNDQQSTGDSSTNGASALKAPHAARRRASLSATALDALWERGGL